MSSSYQTSRYFLAQMESETQKEKTHLNFYKCSWVLSRCSGFNWLTIRVAGSCERGSETLGSMEDMATNSLSRIVIHEVKLVTRPVSASNVLSQNIWNFETKKLFCLTTVYFYIICALGKSRWRLIRRGADKSLAFLISPMGGLQHNQKNFSWMG
jgi:hypothetical protein